MIPSGWRPSPEREADNGGPKAVGVFCQSVGQK